MTATPAESIEVDGDILDTSFDIRRTFEIDELNRIERTSSDSLDLSTLSGFSLKFGDGAWRADASDGSGVKIESLIAKGILLLQFERIGSDRDVDIKDYIVRTRDGQAIPGWLERPQADLLQGRVPSDVEVLELLVEAHLSDGRILSQPVRVWTMTGEIKPRPTTALNWMPATASRKRHAIRGAARRSGSWPKRLISRTSPRADRSPSRAIRPGPFAVFIRQKEGVARKQATPFL